MSKMSHRQILKSSVTTGGASIITILISLVRTKIIAILLGPTGIGLASLYGGLMATATVIVTMGVGNVGTRQVAEVLSQNNEHALAVVRRAIFWGTLLLASIGSLLIWSLRELLAIKVLGGSEHSTTVGWLTLGVALSVMTTAQGALMQGMRQIGDMARLSIFSSLIGTVLGLALLWQWGQAGLLAYVLVGPLVSFCLGHWYVSRLPRVTFQNIKTQELLHQWQILLRLGVPFMGAALMNALVNLWIRVEIGKTFGENSLGNFQAAWTISMQYIGFLLSAMMADYYPRLTSVIGDYKAATRLVNEQTEISLLLCGPIFIATIGMAPWLINFLYSSAFIPAAEILRWQILGDVLKVASFPLGFIIVATGASKTFFFIESTMLVFMGSVISIYSSSVGLEIAGISFLLSYALYLGLSYLFAWRNIKFHWTDRNIKLIAATFFLCTISAIISTKNLTGLITTALLSLAFAAYSFYRILSLLRPNE